MTQAGRQGSPRNSSGRNSAGQAKDGQNRAGRNPARGGSSRAAGAGGAGFKGGGDRPFKHPKPREEAFVDPDLQGPGGAPADRPAAGDWKPGKPAARKPGSRKPGAGKVPGTPGALKPKPRSAAAKTFGTRAFGGERFGQNLGAVRKPSRKRGPRGDVPQSEMHDADGIRLQKVMASAGVASRRVCEEMISEGRVEVDGKVVTELGVRVDPKTAVIHVDGLRIQLDENMVYMVFNKPKGVVSTMEDPDGRPCISDFVRNTHGERLFHVGRLDVATEGLLLLTNDGELANRLTHPSYEVPKTYLVQVRGPFPQGIGAQLKAGVELEDGMASVDSFKLVDSTPGHVLIEVVLHSGKNRIVRRLFDAVGFPVLRLVRVKVGPIGLGDQRQGSIRNLGKQEVGHLLASVGL
ncbi:23S rRNA pseudouridine2605 synthase/16S rRNA pseudouridine516 synthase [Arthrobacter sp. PvP102]|jgi:23S rRNA pseudouridine2605 synthase/16S rRNA pseudouridine516 synthase|uniref:pseudouridine synthase n=1 Tax=unclassified Arthrobacter TaxID=235627 RepID=UPI0000E5D5C4|nr:MULTISPECIES: pseudouridine synthase [unclassified Arthrobacter]ABK02928.1 Pseudouridine synthase, Rsu [Arthrobacter sp. FB24]MBP1235032.1 23S rRNA pseudouridine2605 synthase/16S rRNA pseudouridine516 synthase [Arthrobacter sp. PvP103]MBP1235991.1 23S rRNA pseudouridine2605 synthase/16S rRNA pseudouridine516 synthase [Arthrobacter sp. PvP102]